MYTYDLETTGGRTRAGLETVIPVVILIVCGYFFVTTENYTYGVAVVVVGFWLILVTGAAWLHTLELQRIERNKLERETLTITPEIILERERNIGKKRNIELLTEIDRLKDLLGENLVYIDEPANIEQQVMQAKFGFELWKYCLVLAMALLIAESILVRKAR